MKEEGLPCRIAPQRPCDLCRDLVYRTYGIAPTYRTSTGTILHPQVWVCRSCARKLVEQSAVQESLSDAPPLPPDAAEPKPETPPPEPPSSS